jgi:superfamily II DNA or RNA helicase
MGGLEEVEVILWDCQERTLDAIAAAAQAGHKRICVTLPTGGGKTVIMGEMTRRFSVPTVLYTNRRMLREQTSDRMDAFGIEHGVRASGSDPALLRDVQVSSIMTEESRVFRRKTWELHPAKLVHIDECHNQTGNVAKKIINAHVETGAVVIGFTATPLDLDGIYEHLIIGAVNSELRDCGAHVICQTYAPDEPDLRHVKQVKVGEDLSDAENTKAIMRPGIFGRVFDTWLRLNPDGRPTILFGPDVAGSLWFAEQFYANGVSAAHIDGERIWIKGETMPSDQENREHLAALSKSGEVQVVCNRFVMREGIDWPWLYHAIMATVFGSVTSYLQSGGRLLRAHQSIDHVLLQDHGGNYHRHGSLNSDREWSLGLTSHMVTSLRQERLRDKKESEPIVCPSCGHVRSGGDTCRQCGHKTTRKSRVVVQATGELKEVEGEIYKPRRVKELPDTEKIWRQCYMRAKNSKNGMTFRQAEGLFFYENHYYPPRNLPFMPVHEADWFRKVKDVPVHDLSNKQQGGAA